MQEEFYFSSEKLCVGYANTPVVSDVDIRLKRGEILTLIGPNGAGKTTVLRSIMKQLQPIAGVMMLDQKDLAGLDARELAKKMGVVLTERIQSELMTVRDIVETGRYPYTGRFGVLSEADHQIVSEVMRLVKIDDLAELDFAKISDGQRQRVMLARALAQEPEIILLDEPTSFLDIKYKLEFLSILKRLAKEKQMTVIMSLHEVELAGAVSDWIACLKNGKMDRLGRAAEIFCDGYLSKLYEIDHNELTDEFIKVAEICLSGRMMI